MEILFFLLKITGLLILEIFLIIIFNLLSGKIKTPVVRIIEDSEVPVHIKTFLEDSAKRLVKLGFSYSHYIYKEGFYAGVNSDNWGLVLLNIQRSTFAIIRIADYPNKLNPYLIEYITYFTDNRALLTINNYRHFIVGSIPDIILNDPYTVTTEQQWYSHLNILNKIKSNSMPVILSRDMMTCYENIISKKYIDRLADENKIVNCNKDNYRMKFFTALKQAVKIISGLRKHIQLRNHKMKLPVEAVDIPGKIIIEKYWNPNSVNTSKSRFLDKDKFINSIVLILVFSALILFPFQYALAGIFIILFIEIGRYIEKILFANRNGKILY